MTFAIVDIGNTVLCDACNGDFTNRSDRGGILFADKAICPQCTPSWEHGAKLSREERFIRGRCPDSKSFADWVREDIRKGDNKIVIGPLDL